MAERTRISLDDIRKLGPGQELWDTAVAGFGARRQRSEAVSYILLYRIAGNPQNRRFTIGRHGAPWTPDGARKEARRLLGAVADGKDPALAKKATRHAVTVADLCHNYLADAEAGRVLVRGGKSKKPGTLLFDKGCIEGHIIPVLGRMAVAAVTKRDVERFMHAVADGKTANTRKTKPRGVSRISGGRGIATRAVGLVGGIFSYAVDHGMRMDNPAHRVRKFAENKRHRRLTDAEYATLGVGLRQAEKVWPPAVSCLQFLAVSGWRSGEAVALRWRDLDMLRRAAVLPDTKTGRSTRPLSAVACDVLRAIPRGADDALVFPATRGDGLMLGFKKFARKILTDAGLPEDVTPHVLRHSFISLAGDLGLSLPITGAIVGHKGQGITATYTHLAATVLLAAADAVANETLARMGDGCKLQISNV